MRQAIIIFILLLISSCAFADGTSTNHARGIRVYAAGFTGNLSAIDVTVQKALETLDALVVGGAEADTLQSVMDRGATFNIDMVGNHATDTNIRRSNDDGKITMYGGNDYQNGAYFSLTGDDYNASPGKGSGEFVIREEVDSEFSVYSFDGASTWTKRFSVMGSTGLITMNSTTAITGVLDQDDLSSDSATHVPTQQSVKAYIDSKSHTDDQKMDVFSYSGITLSASLEDDGEANKTVTFTNLATGAFTVTFDGSGSAVAASSQWRGVIPFACTLSRWYIVTDQSGTCVLDIWVDNWGTTPDNGDSITNGHEPQTSAGISASDTDISDWSDLSMAAYQEIIVNVDSNATHEQITLVVIYEKT